MLFTTLALGGLSLLAWPLNALRLARRRARRPHPARAQRVVILGLDALDPRQVRRLVDRGELPNFAQLAREGTCSNLGTTCPPISPVAWATFMTGVNPGKHNIFDFLSRNPATYAIELSSSQVSESPRRFGRPRVSVTGRRKSVPFWKLLGDFGVPSTILRVPITFPPEPFHGRLLAGMCVPDLRGTQGEFTVFESHPPAASSDASGGLRIPVTIANNRIATTIPGPTVEGHLLHCPINLRLDPAHATLHLNVCDQHVTLKPGSASAWVTLIFQHRRRRIHGICRFLLVSLTPTFRLYVTPLNIDPAHPALPISHPAAYALYLAKLHGPFATLGIAEDTWALNQNVITEEQYRQQVYDIHAEREAMFMDALARTRHGLCTCVFDTPDRIQHVFWTDPDAHPLEDSSDPTPAPAHQAVIDDLYRRMDALLGRVLHTIDSRTALIVLSDHGFARFDNAVNLNAWLRTHGYLTVLPATGNSEHLQSVDWSRTRAYAFGLGGVYLNLVGREGQGIVSPGADASALKRELATTLMSLRLPESNTPVVHTVHDTATTWSGPYTANGPDLIVGFHNGFRASWDNAVGRTDGPIFQTNDRHWRADHIVDHSLVPGILLSNRKLVTAPHAPHIVDIAPTVLELFGLDVPSHMDGRSLAGDAPHGT